MASLNDPRMSSRTRSPWRRWRWLAASVVLTGLAAGACRKLPLPWRRGGSPDAVAAPRTIGPGDGKASLAINSSGVEYWGQEWTFVDLVKRAKDWAEKPGAEYRVDANGWVSWMAPDTRRTATIGDGNPGHDRSFPAGKYLILYEGQGRVALQCDACRELSRAPGRVVVDVGASARLVQIIIESIDPENYLKNIRVIPAEFEATHLTQPFHPRFLERLRPFAAIRHFGYQKTNGSLQTKWSDRAKPTDAFQAGDGGVAVEYLVQMSNVAKVDPWFCIPPRADDDYVRRFARLVFEQLDQDRKVYLEYGNEIWNEAEPYSIDGAWMTARARQLAIPLNRSDDGSDLTYRLRYQVIRSRQIFEIWKQEMAAKRIDPRRLVRVISSQASFFDRIRFTLDYKFADGTFAYQHADALGVAPYFAGLWTPKESGPAETAWSIDDLITYADCSASDPARAPAACAKIPHESIVPTIRGDWALAKERKLRLLGYEGGQHMVAWGARAPFIDKLARVNRDPRMKGVYLKYLNAWRENGGELMFLLGFIQDYGKHGYWGMLERQDQPRENAPKYAAAMEFLERVPSWWVDAWPPRRTPGGDAGNAAKAGNAGSPANPARDAKAAPGGK